MNWKELRSLDARVEYLRRSYVSLRTGRRNLRFRMCRLFSSTPLAKVTYGTMRKHEYTLGVLDDSIDDWFVRLEQAENRRLRIRQKLLEHIAAALILPVAHTISPSSGGRAGK